MSKFLIVYGTRPEAIKLKPLIEEMKRAGLDFEVLFTGQQPDLSDDILKGTKVDPMKVLIGVPLSTYNRLDELTFGYLRKIGNFMDDFSPDLRYYEERHNKRSEYTHVIVQGDTASAYAGALAAFHRQVPIIHIEAGLRTYSKDPYPEEFYRRSISLMAGYHFCPTEENKDNLDVELAGGNRYVVGNTGLDGLGDSDVTVDDEILVTFHRRENRELALEYARSIWNITKEFNNYKFTIIGHPNETSCDFRQFLKDDILISGWPGGIEPNIEFVDPLSHDKLIQKIKTCRLILSDSGGISEEISYYHKRAIILRKSTERQEIVGKNITLCSNPSTLGKLFISAIGKETIVKTKCPYYHGGASQKIVKVLKDL